MITGAVIGFLIFATIALIGGPPKAGFDYGAVIFYVLLFTLAGAGIGYLIAGVPSCG